MEAGTSQVAASEVEALRAQIAESQRLISQQESRARQLLRQSELLQATNRVLREALTCGSEQEVAAVCLRIAQELTGSQFGFIAEVNAQGRVETIAISDPGWEACRIGKTDAVRMLKDMEIRGIYGAVIQKQRSMIFNEPPVHPAWVGPPPGHPPITCFLGVPLKEEGDFLGMTGLANKPGGYEPADQEAIEMLSVAFVEALRRKRLEKLQERLRRELERRVQQRTRDLLGANKALRREAAERGRAEQEVLRSRERFRRFFELGLVGFAILAPDGTPLEVNDRLCEMLGYSREEALRMSWPQVMHPEELDSALARFNQILRGKLEGNVAEKRLIRKDGQVLDVVVSTKCVRRPDGSPEYVLAVIEDISARKRAEEALLRGRENLLGALEAMQDGVYIGDREFNVQYANSALRDHFGAVNGRKCYQYFHDRQEPCPWCRNEEVFAGKTARWEEYCRKTDRVYELIGTPLRNPDGTVSKLEIFRDVTDRKKAEERLERLQADLAHVGRLTTLGEMASGLAHELNQPLTGILMRAEVAARKLELGRELGGSRLAELLRFIADQAHRGGQIIRRMREFVKRNGAARGPIEVREVVTEVAALVTSELRHRGILLDIDLRQPLPKIIADKIQVQQVLLNLMRNAVDAMEDTPAGARTIRVRAELRESMLQIAVADTGCGIPPEQMGRLFTTFQTTKPFGMGMGLAISRSIVELHGGRIWAARNGERGSVFTFTLPLADKEDTQ